MLFKAVHLKGINSGAITLAFRKWEMPSDKKGTIQHSPIGQIQILDILKQHEKDLSVWNAKLAGYSSLTALKLQLSKITSGELYRIVLRYFGEDPRITLRNQINISQHEQTIILHKLNSFDQRAKAGAWTKTALQLIQDYPETGAEILADMMKVEKDWLKPNIRKLKNLGLTSSLKIGYALSPRGVTVLKLLEDNQHEIE